VINGVLAPFLLVGILIAASDRKLMQGQPSSWLSRIVVGIVTLEMFGAGRRNFFPVMPGLFADVKFAAASAPY
jgi:hypothetical protein